MDSGLVVNRHPHAEFGSNTYLLSSTKEDVFWLVDAGSAEFLRDAHRRKRSLKGVFLTHAHFDHIYSINEVIRQAPQAVIYTSEYGKTALYSDKVNLSYYHGRPIQFAGGHVEILKEAMSIRLFKNIQLEVMETPGHDRSCLTYRVGSYLFTGDSYIPGQKVVTKLKGGDRLGSKASLERILSLVNPHTIVCPGHGEMV